MVLLWVWVCDVWTTKTTVDIMIRINLAAGSGEKQATSYWYIMDLLVLLAVYAIGHYGMQYYMSVAKESINIVNSETESVKASIAKLQKYLTRFKTLEADINQLNNKINAIKSITVSVFERYKPLIVLEHLQVLQPDGLWYDSLVMSDANVKIKGAAFDNIMVAEFLTALDSTKTQEVDHIDLRTQVYFDSANLLGTTLGKANFGGKDLNVSSTTFSLDVSFKTRSYEIPEGNKNKELAVNDVRGS